MSHEPPSGPAFDTELTLSAQRRAAVDEIAAMRARVARCALFATYLQSPDPAARDAGGWRDRWLRELRDQYADLDRARQLLGGHDPEGLFPDEVCAWVARNAEPWPEYSQIVEQMCALTKSVVDAAPDGGPRLMSALKVHMEFGHLQFHHAITGFCDGIWAQLDAQRHAEVRGARDTAATIADTLKRLEHIGKHVRLVSLNASVEAARVGEAGKGLGVIAVEFKSLAEEIQALAVTARDRIEGLRGEPVKGG